MVRISRHGISTFRSLRVCLVASVFVFTLIVLGVAANLASNFLGTSAVPSECSITIDWGAPPAPEQDCSYRSLLPVEGVIIFSLTVTPATILGLILL